MTCNNRVGSFLLDNKSPLLIDPRSGATSLAEAPSVPRRGLWSALCGQRVRICKGVFRGVEGTLAGRRTGRWVIAVDLAECGVTLEINSDAVQFIESE